MIYFYQILIDCCCFFSFRLCFFFFFFFLGYACPLGATTPTACTPGNYQSGSGASSCSACTANSYCSGNSVSTPTACPAGSTSPQGSSSASQCSCTVTATSSHAVLSGNCASGSLASGSSCINTCAGGYQSLPGTLTCTNGVLSGTNTFCTLSTVCTPQPANIIAWYTGSSLTDVIGTNTPSVVGGGVVYTSAMVGNGFSFSANYYLSLANGASTLPLGSGARTVECWWQTSYNPVSNSAEVLSYGSPSVGSAFTFGQQTANGIFISAYGS